MLAQRKVEEGSPNIHQTTLLTEEVRCQKAFSHKLSMENSSAPKKEAHAKHSTFFSLRPFLFSSHSTENNEQLVNMSHTYKFEIFGVIEKNLEINMPQ